MPGEDETDPVDDEELLFRRIPASMRWYTEGELSPEAFDPRTNETTGISFYRAKFKSLQQAAKGKSKGGYYVAVLRAGDLRNHGIRVVPRTALGDPGHAELPDLTCQNRLTPEASERKLRMAELCLRIEGPFPPATD